jgi:aspartate kinase
VPAGEADPVLVLRFGGSSLSTPPRVRHAAERIRFHVGAGERVATVVSTPGCGRKWVSHWTQRLGKSESPPVARELDRAAAADEDLTASLIAGAVAALGVPAVSLSSREARLQGEGEFGAGRFTSLDAGLIRRHMANGTVVVLAGGNVRRPDGETLVLGQRGADVVAVVLADTLAARACHIVIELDRFDTSTPRGEHVHPEALRLAAERGITVEVYSFRVPFGTEGVGKARRGRG